MTARFALALCVALALPGVALAQGGGGLPNGGRMPTKDEINAKAKDILGKSETHTAEVEGVAKLTYKAIPTSSDAIGKTFGEEYKKQIPQGVDIDAIIRQFGPQIQEALDTYLTEPEGWKFEALVDIKVGSKTIKKGEYKVSLAVEGEVLRSVLLTQGEAGKKPSAQVRINLAPVKPDKKAGEQTFEKLKFDFVPILDKKGEKTKDVSLTSEFVRTLVKSKEPLKPTEAKGGEKKNEKK